MKKINIELSNRINITWFQNPDLFVLSFQPQRDNDLVYKTSQTDLEPV